MYHNFAKPNHSVGVTRKHSRAEYRVSITIYSFRHCWRVNQVFLWWIQKTELKQNKIVAQYWLNYFVDLMIANEIHLRFIKIRRLTPSKIRLPIFMAPCKKWGTRQDLRMNNLNNTSLFGLTGLFRSLVLASKNELHCRHCVFVGFFSSLWNKVILSMHSFNSIVKRKTRLTLSWRRLLSYRNQSIDLPWKSMDWFRYDNGPRHERVKLTSVLI